MRRVTVMVVWATGVFSLVLVVLLLALQLDGVSTRAGAWIADIVSSEELQIEVDRVTGDWVRGLDFRGLKVSSAASAEGRPGWEASAETLVVRYRLLPLLQRTIAVKAIEASGVDLRLSLAEGQSRKPPKETDEEPSSWTVRFNSLDLRGIRVRIREPSTSGVLGQGPWQLSNGVLMGRDLVIGPGLTV
ncbi:MAG: hypothetical protein PVJ76_16735, partial [Gemmatimonadota bacterium]